MHLKQSLLAFTIIILALVAIGCNDDEKEKENKVNILGTWTLTSIQRAECDIPEENDIVGQPCNDQECETYHFSSDSAGQNYVITTLIDGVPFNEVGTYSVGESNLELCIDNEGELECISYSLGLSVGNMSLSRNDEESGCKETFIFEKNPSEE